MAILGTALFAATIAMSLAIQPVVAMLIFSSMSSVCNRNLPVIAATTSPTPMNLGAR